MMDRRGLLVGLAAGSGVVSLSPVVHAACLPTAQQVEGPFYPVEIGEQDRDLTHVTGGVARALGEVIEISGKVIDRKCNISISRILFRSRQVQFNGLVLIIKIHFMLDPLLVVVIIFIAAVD